VFSPLDDELELLPGELTPSLVEGLVRLGAWLPFRPAAALLGHFHQVTVSEATARRRTEQAGAAYVAVQEAQVAALERELPPAPAGPAVQQLSVDGAMVPLVGPCWGEVKLLAIGTLEAAPAGEVHARDVSYFGRMTDAATFGRLATVETHRRGTERAGRVGAVVDGAEWQQGFIDLHRADAVRILDFPHAAEHVAAVGQAVFGTGTAATATWLDQQLHALKHGAEATVLAVLAELRARLAEQGASETLDTVAEQLAYLEKRREQLRYAAFQAAGYPIGSGMVESGNKLVTEARLKGAGMHWAPPHVNPMVALRTLVCADRWDEGWAQIRTQLRADLRQRTPRRRSARHQDGPPAPPEPPCAQTAAPRGRPRPRPGTVTAGPLPPPRPTGSAPRHPRRPPRPAANHPWRRSVVPLDRRSRVAS
jgi:hypothetical protein